MSTTYVSNSIIGVQVDPSKFFIRKFGKTFEHDYPEEFEFCPKAGKPLWKEEYVPLSGADGDASYDKYDKRVRYNLYKFKDWEVYSEGDLVVIGVGTKTESRSLRVGRIDIPDIKELMEKLQADLEPIDAWHYPFGLYSVLSYF